MASYNNKIWTVKDVLFWTSDYFLDHDISSPHLNAELLIAHVLHCSRLDLYLKYDKPLSDVERNSIKQLIKRRITHYPLQYILGEVEFYGQNLHVEEGVLIPRPETEILVDVVLNHIKENQKDECNVLDIGTGSGNIAISLSISVENNDSSISVVAVDISEKALEVAKKNAEHHNLDNIAFIHSDIFENINDSFDYIISNPPYISELELATLSPEIKNFEPKEALCAKSNGLEFYERILKDADKYLKNDGRIFFEIGATQKQAIEKYAFRYNFKIIDSKKDYNDFDRVLILKKNK